jgi:hypothetical protein
VVKMAKFPEFGRAGHGVQVGWGPHGLRECGAKEPRATAVSVSSWMDAPSQRKKERRRSQLYCTWKSPQHISKSMPG